MNILDAMNARHSVRQYIDRPIEKETEVSLQKEIELCNKESGLNIQLIADEPKAFDGFMAHYGKFEGVKNYIALIGKKSPNLEEKCGYYGERLVLFAQQLGLNTCWVAMTYKKIPGVFRINEGEKLVIVIAIGYGKTQGTAHQSKKIEGVLKTGTSAPEWFYDGVKAALLAPTALNQQKFMFSLKDHKVSVKPGLGFYTKIDLGIVKYHFEIGAGKENFRWGI